MSKKIIVTGGSGGVGSYVVQDLCDHGYTVLNLDRAESGETLCRHQKIDLKGSENFIIAAPDTIMSRSNRELIDAVFPGVPIDEGMGDHETMISIGKAEKLLSWKPEYSWRRVPGSATAAKRQRA